MKYYRLSLITLFTLFTIVGCSDPKPEVVTKTPVKLPTCTIEKHSAPLWCCEGEKDTAFMSMMGHHKDKKLANDVTYWNFQEKVIDYLSAQIEKNQELHLTKQDTPLAQNAKYQR